MRLELEKTIIRHMQFGPQTGVQDGKLTINRDELARLLEKDQRLRKVDLDIALPGENCRILHTIDVIEPRFKPVDRANGGPTAVIGQGRTRALKGAAIVISDFQFRGGSTLATDPLGAIIDMTGPGAEVSPFGQTCNLVLLATPRENLPAGDYQVAVKQAAVTAGSYLAQAACRQPADDTTVFELPPLTRINEEMAPLPKVVYIPQIYSLQFVPIPGEPVLFGRQADGIIPTLLHPNQILDGAVTSAYPGINLATYHIQNAPVVESLYRRHGRDLFFCGVIVTVAPNNVADFDRMADLAAETAKHMVGADGAILTKTAGGAPELAMAKTAQRCEQLGIKTVIAMLNMGADVKDFKYGAATIFNLPEVDAIVSMGTPYLEIALPQMEKLIGKTKQPSTPQPGTGDIVRPLAMIKGAVCQMGSSKLTAVRY